MQIKINHGHGNHLIIDVFGCDKNLDDKDNIQKLLENLPENIGMKRISEAFVMQYDSQDNEESGITGFVILAESHISIHTYPKKEFASIDIFSCKEFDYNAASEKIKQFFSAEKAEQKLISRGHSELFDADNKLSKIKGPIIDEDNKIIDLMKDMKNIGFQATHLGQSLEVLKKIKESDATLFLSFTSNMVSSGLREIFAQMVKDNMVDVIITSAGAVEEDIMKSKKDFLLGDFNVSDIELHKKGINRIGNIFVPDDRYELLEDILMPFFNNMMKKQKKENKLISPSQLIFELGKSIEDDKSILYWASKNNIPIYCPGITDGALGLQLYFFKQKNQEFGIDVTADMKDLADKILLADKTAGIILGGGIAKHHLIGVNILREGLDYAIYVTTSSEGDGSLSGARPKEAKSWSKLKEEGNNVCIEGDATIIFPLIAHSMKKIWCEYE